MPGLRPGELNPMLHVCLCCIWVLHAGFNAEYLLHHEERLRTRISAIEQEATRLVGSSINLASAAQLSVALYDTLALPAPRNRSDRSAVHSKSCGLPTVSCSCLG